MTHKWFNSVGRKMRMTRLMLRGGSSIFLLVGTASGYCAWNSATIGKNLNNHHSTEKYIGSFLSPQVRLRSGSYTYHQSLHKRWHNHHNQNDELTFQHIHPHGGTDGTRINSNPVVMATSAASPIPTGDHVATEEDVGVQSYENVDANARTYATNADVYYRTNNQKIPLPKIMHDSLRDMIQRDKRSYHYYPNEHENEEETNNHELEAQQQEIRQQQQSDRILVIGDVHGCYSELKSLVHKASVEFNGNKPFIAVVLVGDLCNKGPDSAKVVRFVRNQKNWYSVRGNHDNAALAAALGDETRKDQEKYRWVSELSDDDVDWLSNLPYTITIPKAMLGDNKEEDCGRELESTRDVVIVHAGLVPGIPLCQQDIKTMTTIREVTSTTTTMSTTGTRTCHNNDGPYEYYTKSRSKGKDEANVSSHVHVSPWAKVWNGPQQIIFGHDARRGYQSEPYAIGLDEGCCYGKKLTGIILPEKELVSVNAEKVHCPIK